MTILGAEAPGDRLIFLHIPKTAGVSLSLFLNARFRPEEVFHVRAPGRGPSFGAIQGPLSLLRALPVEWRSRFRCVLGHFEFSDDLHASLPGRSRYVTVLRDPVERALSQHGQYNRHRELDGRPRINLREFLRTPGALTDNHQTRALCSGSFDTAEPSTNLESAKENLRRNFLAVGTTERSDDFFRVLTTRAGFDSRERPRDNVNPHRYQREDVSSDILDELRARSELDRELHRFAGELLDEAIREVGSGRHAARFVALERGARRRLEGWLNRRSQAG